MLNIDPARSIHAAFYSNSGKPLDSGWDSQTWLGDPPAPGRVTFYPGTSAADANKGTVYSAMVTDWQGELAALGAPYTIKGIIWVQGEADTKHTISANRYATSLDRLVDRLHGDFGLSAGSVPFLYSRLLSTAAHFPYADDLRQQQDNADRDSGHADSIPNAYLVDTSGLTFTDGVHYDAASQTTLGQRFAHELEGPPPPGPSVITGVTATASSQVNGNTPASRTTDSSGFDGTNHGTAYKGHWFSNNIISIDEQYIQWDLGAPYVLDSVQVWNGNQNVAGSGFGTDEGVNQLDIYVSSVESPGDPEGAGAANWTLLKADATFTQAPGSTTYTGFDLATEIGTALPSSAFRWIRFEVDCFLIGSYPNVASLSEIRFYEVPEPATGALILLGGLLMARRRRA